MVLVLVVGLVFLDLFVLKYPFAFAFLVSCQSRIKGKFCYRNIYYVSVTKVLAISGCYCHPSGHLKLLQIISQIMTYSSYFQSLSPQTCLHVR